MKNTKGWCKHSLSDANDGFDFDLYSTSHLCIILTQHDVLNILFIQKIRLYYQSLQLLSGRVSVCLSTVGRDTHVTITPDALDLTVQGLPALVSRLPWTWDLTVPSPL